MRRVVILALPVVLVAAMLTGIGAIPGGAQQATPAAEPVDRTFESLGIVADQSVAPGRTLHLERFTWMPGVVTSMHTHPGEVDIYYVLSGAIAWSVEGGDAQIMRAAVDGTLGPTETLASGTEATLRAGDAAVFDYDPTGLKHRGRVVGDTPLVMLVAELYDPTKRPA